MMRILVLGANGFVGRRVVQALSASDWAEPVAATRRPGGGIVLDATDAAAVARAIDGVDGVVNCVAGSAETMVAGATALFAPAAKAGKPVVHLSSMAVYGAATGLVAEDAPLRADVGAYSEAKARAEAIAVAAGGPVALLRPGCVYGAGSPQWSERIGRLLIQRRLGDLGANGDGCSNLVHVDDVVAAILAALRAPPSTPRAYNLAMPDAPDWNLYFLNFAKALGAVPIARITGRRLKIEGKLAAPALKIAEIGLGKVGKATLVPPPMPPSLIRLFGQDIRLDPARATGELGIAWTPLDRGVQEAAEALRPNSRSRAPR